MPQRCAEFFLSISCSTSPLRNSALPPCLCGELVYLLGHLTFNDNVTVALAE